jgi:flagellar basal body P-ring protein FlgI
LIQENQNLKVWLIDVDFEKAKRVTELINSKKNLHITAHIANSGESL